MQQLIVLHTPGPGSVVWDPCTGTLSTANASSVTRRRWVGSEKKEPLCKAGIARYLNQVSAMLMWKHGLQVPVTEEEANAAFKRYTDGFVLGTTKSEIEDEVKLSTVEVGAPGCNDGEQSTTGEEQLPQREETGVMDKSVPGGSC